MRLFDLQQEIERILYEEVDRETGEITDDTLAKLAALEADRDAKALDLAAYIKGEECEAEAVKDQAERLAARARVHKNRAARLRAFLAESVLEPGQKLSDERVQLSWRKSEAVVVDNQDQLAGLDEDLVTTDVVYTPKKAEMKKRLKAGEEIAGVHLERRTNLQIR